MKHNEISSICNVCHKSHDKWSSHRRKYNNIPDEPMPLIEKLKEIVFATDEDFFKPFFYPITQLSKNSIANAIFVQPIVPFLRSFFTIVRNWSPAVLAQAFLYGKQKKNRTRETHKEHIYSLFLLWKRDE